MIPELQACTLNLRALAGTSQMPAVLCMAADAMDAAEKRICELESADFRVNAVAAVVAAEKWEAALRKDNERLQAIVANLCAELEVLPDSRLKLLAKQAAEAAKLGGAMLDSVTVPVPNEDYERLRSAIAYGAPYSIQQARVLGVCRICGTSQFSSPDSMVYHYGAEHAHRFCLDREAAEAAKKENNVGKKE